MKKAVLYARVSTDIQQKEGTIDSQVLELKKQILEAGDVLVKEYTDNGHSGAKLDRPALNELREDLKTDLFDHIYFLNTDRIARDVAYQTIIIAEILKYKKQIIINGIDYIHNPENKFQLTVLGAVAELERAKIIERSMRGKLHKLRQGILLNNGSNTYGYRYTKRTKESPGKLLIHEEEAKVVRYIFESYADNKTSWAMIIRNLEEKEILNMKGERKWTLLALRNITRNHTYTGIKYFNTRSHVKTETNPLRKLRYGKKVFKDKSEWIGVKVPVIISKELFEKVQAKIKRNKEVYRNPKQTKLLAGFIRCGECGKSMMAYHRYLRRYYKHNGITKSVSDNVYYKAAYKCSRRHLDRVHIKSLDFKRCSNPEVSVRVLEPFVFKMIKDNVTDYRKLINIVDYKELENTDFEEKINTIDQNIQKAMSDKKKTLNNYATGKIDREEYSNKNLLFDKEINQLKIEKDELLEKISTSNSKDSVEVAVRNYCILIKTRVERCNDFQSKRQFLSEFIEKVIFNQGKVTVRGKILIKSSTIYFNIVRNIDKLFYKEVK